MKRRTVILFILFTVLIEAGCLVLHFGFGLTFTESTAPTIGRLTFGIRIHHGYAGLAMLLIYPFLSKCLANRSAISDTLRSLYLAAAVALLVSDLIHHFLILWPIEGSPGFDLLYR